MNVKERLEEIDCKLKTNNLPAAESASLQIERIWVRSALGEIDLESRIKALDIYLDVLETEKPEVYETLIQRGEDGKNKLMKIADKYNTV
jgi:hypothetical protein